MIVRTASWRTPFVVSASPPSMRSTPSKSVSRPPASRTTTAGAARSQALAPGSMVSVSYGH